jgi:DNA-binding CsgD family transcriptional regulator
MTAKKRAPITKAERKEMRERYTKGESYYEISKIFNCSPRTVQGTCAGLAHRQGGVGRAITTKQIAEIAALRAEGKHVPEISRIVGVSMTSVTRYSPREFKRAGSAQGGEFTSQLKKAEEAVRMVQEAEAAKPKPAPKPIEELPDTVARMIKSLRGQGYKEADARNWAINYYNKNRKQ